MSEESVRRFHDVVRVGNVYGPYGPYRSSLGKQPVWMWVTTNPIDIEYVIGLLRDHVSDWLQQRLNALTTRSKQ